RNNSSRMSSTRAADFTLSFIYVNVVPLFRRRSSTTGRLSSSGRRAAVILGWLELTNAELRGGIASHHSNHDVVGLRRPAHSSTVLRDVLARGVVSVSRGVTAAACRFPKFNQMFE